MPLKIICKRVNSNKAILIYNKKKINCLIGFSGIGNKKREGDGKTPLGVYRFNEVFFRADKLGLVKTNLKKNTITRCSSWSTDSSDLNYNKFRKRKPNFKHEKLYRSDSCYDIIISINYNDKNIKKKGSAIFLHCMETGKNFTEGCVAIEKKELLKLTRLVTTSTVLIIH